MEIGSATTAVAHALGRYQGAWQFAGADLRRAAAISLISRTWDVFLRDAGAGEVGPAHKAAPAQLLLSEDPRRDAMLLWLADRAIPSVADAAGWLARAVGATRRFRADEGELLAAACDALADPHSSGGPIARAISGAAVVPAYAMTLASVIDQFRLDPAFAEGSGSEASVSLPGLPYRHFVAPDPGAAWALNLALLTAASPLGPPPVAGLVSRALFRSDLEPEEIAAALLQGVSSALAASFERLEQIHADLDRGGRALAHRSRNSKAREAWLIVLSLKAISRAQLARGLGLSRAGADIQALALADAGLATLTGGKIAWSRGEAVRDAAHAPLDRGPLGDAVSDLDASLAEIDRLLARTTR